MYKIVHWYDILSHGEEGYRMKNLTAHLNMIRAMKMKPNFSELARIYGVDRRTEKKYYEGKPKNRNKSTLQAAAVDITGEKIKVS